MQKKLFVFHTESIYSRGGEKYLYELFQRLTKKYLIIVYFEKISKEWEKKYKNIGIITEKFWIPKRFYWILLPIYFLINYFFLKKKIKNQDIIYATNFPVNLLAIFLSKKTICHCFEPLAIFYDPVRISSLFPFSRFCVKVAKLLYGWLDYYAIKKSYKLTALNTSVEKYILNVYQRKPDVFIPNGIDTSFFSPQKKKFFSKKKREFIIGHSTDYTVFKGTENFLKAIPSVYKSIKNIKIFITESMVDFKIKQQYLSYIKKYKLDNIINFTGRLTEKKLVAFYCSLDVFCYTASSKCAGGATASLSVLEAQSCGTPVIRSIGNDDEIINKKTGFYVNPYAPQQVSTALINYYCLPLRVRQQMSVSARKYVKKSFSWDVSAKRLNRLIEELIYEK